MADQAKLSDLIPAEGSTKNRKRVGRGNGSGHGTFSGRGCKGTKARSGTSRMRLGFEGGQMPIQRALPARGFRNPAKKHFQIVNVGDIASRTLGDKVDAAALEAAGLIRSADGPVKVLGDGELNRPVTVIANVFSRVAREKITAAGGSAEEPSGA